MQTLKTIDYRPLGHEPNDEYVVTKEYTRVL